MVPMQRHDEGRREPDQQGRAGAVDELGEDVAADVGGPQPEPAARCLIGQPDAVVLHHRVRVVGCEQRGEDRDEDQDRVDDDAGQGEPIAPQDLERRTRAIAEARPHVRRRRGDGFVPADARRRAWPRAITHLPPGRRDPRVERAVDHVGQEVHRHDDDGDQEESALRQRIVVRRTRRGPAAGRSPAS